MYKEKSAASKIKSSTENLITLIYESFILELFILVLALCSYCADKITCNKNHLWKQIVTVTYTLEKTLFAVATFEGLGLASFQTELKKLVVSLLWISRDDNAK